MTVRSSLTPATSGTDEHWTGLGLDWIRAMTNFVDFGLDQDCKILHIFWMRTGFGLSYWTRIA